MSTVIGCGHAEPPRPVSAEPIPAGRYDSASVITAREHKDSVFASAGSPLPTSARATFTGLSYYPIDARYAFEARLSRYPDPEEVPIGASGGDLRRMLRAGTFTLVIDGTPQTLTAYSSPDFDDQLFVPFSDATTGEQTYSVGRYLEPEPLSGSDRYLVDFNRAYQPYCAYNDSYSCPLVPPENRLSIAIEAGERMPAAMADSTASSN